MNSNWIGFGLQHSILAESRGLMTETKEKGTVSHDRGVW